MADKLYDKEIDDLLRFSLRLVVVHLSKLCNLGQSLEKIKSMSVFRLLVVIFAFLIVSTSKMYGQSSVSQERDIPSVIPAFKDGIPGMMRYFSKEIGPVISDHTKDSANFPTSLKMILTIDKKGKVINVKFPNTRMEEECKDILTKKLLDMKGWKAGEDNGKAVVSEYPWYVSCILWQ